MVWKILAGVTAALMILGGINTMIVGGDAWAFLALEPIGAEGANTIRADIGGMFLTSGVVTAIGLYKKRPDFLVVISVMMVLIAAGRIVGIALDGFVQQSLTFFIIEIVIAAILYMSARSIKA